MTAELRRMDDERIAKLEERVANWMESTTEYRRSLCSKLDSIKEQIGQMPCTKGHDMHVDRQLGAIWWIVSVCLVGLVSVSVAWGALNNQVSINTQRWDRVLQEQARGESNRI